MTEVSAEVWYWSPAGMQQVKAHPALQGYVEKRVVERLLEEAHSRGYQQGLANALARINPK